MNGMIETLALSWEKRAVSVVSSEAARTRTHVGGPVVDLGDELASLDINHGEVVRVADQDELEPVDRSA